MYAAWYDWVANGLISSTQHWASGQLSPGGSYQVHAITASPLSGKVYTMEHRYLKHNRTLGPEADKATHSFDLHLRSTSIHWIYLRIEAMVLLTPLALSAADGEIYRSVAYWGNCE